MEMDISPRLTGRGCLQTTPSSCRMGCLHDSHEFIWSILATDVDFAPDGSLYATDWVNGWDGEGKGRLYRFESTDHISQIKGADVPKLLNGGVTSSESPRLIELLSHEDRRVRQQAQFELAKREEFKLLSDAALSSDEFTRIHVAWAIWQLGLDNADMAREVSSQLPKLITQPSETGIQYLRILNDLVMRHGVDAINQRCLVGDLQSTSEHKPVRDGRNVRNCNVFN